jgi:hypothetical protein
MDVVNTTLYDKVDLVRVFILAVDNFTGLDEEWG